MRSNHGCSVGVAMTYLVALPPHRDGEDGCMCGSGNGKGRHAVEIYNQDGGCTKGGEEVRWQQDCCFDGRQVQERCQMGQRMQ